MITIGSYLYLCSGDKLVFVIVAVAARMDTYRQILHSNQMFPHKTMFL